MSRVRWKLNRLMEEKLTRIRFLENLANLDFGTQQTSGEKIHDVKLPPWAKRDPLLFVTLNRRVSNLLITPTMRFNTCKGAGKRLCQPKFARMD